MFEHQIEPWSLFCKHYHLRSNSSCPTHFVCTQFSHVYQYDTNPHWRLIFFHVALNIQMSTVRFICFVFDPDVLSFLVRGKACLSNICLFFGSVTIAFTTFRGLPFLLCGCKVTSVLLMRFALTMCKTEEKLLVMMTISSRTMVLCLVWHGMNNPCYKGLQRQIFTFDLLILGSLIEQLDWFCS